MPHMGFHPDDNITLREPEIHGDPPTQTPVAKSFWNLHEATFIYNINSSNLILLTFCTKHSSLTAVLCAKSQND